jgi:tetratricopeptide (TPR) repeat protein
MAELDNLRAAVGLAAARALPRIAAQIPIAMGHFFHRTSYEEIRVAMDEIGVRAARQPGDDAALSHALIDLGMGYRFTGRPTEGEACLAESAEIRRRTGDQAGETMALSGLALILHSQGRITEAVDCHYASLSILASIGQQHSRNAAIVLNNLGDTLLDLRRDKEALEYADRTLAIFQQIGDSFAASITEGTIAKAHLAAGRYDHDSAWLLTMD